MSRERKAYPKEFKVKSVELSNTRTDLTALAKELALFHVGTFAIDPNLLTTDQCQNLWSSLIFKHKVRLA